jgi:hypothetical protein
MAVVVSNQLVLDLRTAATLHNNGSLSDADFQAQKDAILKAPPPAPPAADRAFGLSALEEMHGRGVLSVAEFQLAKVCLLPPSSQAAQQPVITSPEMVQEPAGTPKGSKRRRRRTDGEEVAAIVPTSRRRSLVVRVEGQPAESPSKRQLCMIAHTESTVGTAVAWNDCCFDCKGRGHWRGSRECPMSSRSPAVRALGQARGIRYTAMHDSVCGGCGGAITSGESIISPMDGMGADGATVWWHQRCTHGKFALVASSVDDATRSHQVTPEIAAIVNWVSTQARAHAVVMAGPGTGKTQLVCRVVSQIRERAKDEPLVLAYQGISSIAAEFLN